LFCVLSLSYSGLVVSTCQATGKKDSSDETSSEWGDYLHKDQVEECYIFVFIKIYCPRPRPWLMSTII